MCGGLFMKTAIVIDSGSNYYNEGLEVEGIFAIPLQIIHGDKAYLESVEISVSEVNKLMGQGEMLKTSLPSLGKIEELFIEIKNQGYDRIFGVPITSGISGTINAMVTAAQFADINFDYIDCFTAAHNELEIALGARKLFDQGKDIPEVKEILDISISDSNTYIIPDDLSHLSRGGRLSPLAAKLGGFLKIKPILHLDKSTKGVIEPFGKVRTMSKAVDTVIADMRKKGVGKGYFITVTDVNNPAELEVTMSKLKSEFPDAEFSKTQLISTVGVHVGVGAIALQYIKLPSV